MDIKAQVEKFYPTLDSLHKDIDRVEYLTQEITKIVQSCKP